jgi:hypothetical protein
MTALAVGIAGAAALGVGYVGLIYPSLAEESRDTEYERAYLRREALKDGAMAGAVVGLVGGVVGLMAAKGRPAWKAAGFGALSLLPAAFVVLINPYTMMLAILMIPMCVVGGGLSGWIAVLLGTRRGLTPPGRGPRI